MGKMRPRTTNKKFADAFGKSQDPALQELREVKIKPAVQDLQSADLNNRLDAANVISNMIENPQCRRLLLRENIVRVLLEQSLTDLNLETRAAGWEILGKLAILEDQGFCIHLYREDILTAIGGAFRLLRSLSITQILGDASLSEDVPKPHWSILWNMTSSVISLLSSFSEVQLIVEAINRSHDLYSFIHFLLLLSPDSVPLDVQYEALNCLAALTQENESMSAQIFDKKPLLFRLLEIKNSLEVTSILACAVLHNAFTSLQSPALEGATDGDLIIKLTELIKCLDHREFGDHLKTSKPLLEAIDVVASIAADLQESLEHQDQTERLPKGLDNGQLEEDDELLPDADAEKSGSDELAKTIEYLVRDAAPQMLSYARPSHKNPSGDEDVQLHAISALNNIAWTISNIDHTNSDGDLWVHWFSLAQQIWHETIGPVISSDTADIELASSITSLAWALARSVKGVVGLQAGEPTKFMALYQSSRNSDDTPKLNESDDTGVKEFVVDVDVFQGLGVKCIGVLGQLGLNPAPDELNREIGSFLLHSVLKDSHTPPAESIEALNQLIEIYADKDFHYDFPVFWNDGFYGHLAEYLPIARKMAKRIDKRKDPELRMRADEAVIDLGRFLRYKKGERG